MTDREDKSRKRFDMKNIHAYTEVQDIAIKLHVILMVGSIFVGFICLAGLLTWLITDFILLSPFASILGLIASPFFYVMGRITKNKGEHL